MSSFTYLIKLNQWINKSKKYEIAYKRDNCNHDWLIDFKGMSIDQGLFDADSLGKGGHYT